LGATQEETEGAVEQQELCNEEVRVDTKCHWRTDMCINIWLCCTKWWTLEEVAAARRWKVRRAFPPVS
jgi:hypothetical protein